MSFKDHFSVQAEEYSKFRPRYPDELFKYLASLVDITDTAWDSATGNGQAAIGLTPYFKNVIATDASESQILHAEPHPKIEYRVVPAENSGLESASADLITVATAIHWLDTDKFYSEVKRVLRKNGVIAVWQYAENSISQEVDAVTEKFTKTLVDEYWPIENKKAWDFENSIPFPFEKIETPEFIMKLNWDLDHYLNFLYTWSATQNYIKIKSRNPLEIIYDEFKDAWGDPGDKKEVNWKLKMKTGRV
jgi:SAM-dependent methyltransferase